MKTLTTLLISLLAVACNAFAQAPDLLEIKAAKISPPEARKAYQDFRGTYDMSDGSVFAFLRHGNQYLAQIDALKPMELRYAGEGRFTTLSGRTEFHFAKGGKVTMIRENGIVIASR